MKQRIHTPYVLAAALGLACGGAWAQAKVQDPWARPTAQGQANGGGFLKLEGGASADRLLGVSAEVSKSVELHSMVMEGDVMRMRQLDGIDVPAGKSVELKPGGLHIMFMGLKAPLKGGESFPLTLRFEKAGEVKVQVQVQVRQPQSGQAGSGSSMGGDHAGHKH